ncbi:TfpX/TfpZ family type IV pilin accessory protein [Acinetobacter ursingii]|uniref:TfpX/TfpZ family type IV pilin accessory protein n=1 Tax=Acinetobacter ursingii TaxID=108980 RepID=UPI000CBB6CFA|nr:TfpX/TfpZ family type IV pilin accessory protein [Acinetobacter ursingii]MCU4305847.1 type IV pilin accessory protein [Acinetobacter ursingii]MCU4372592.1 type IV pilin accessory protein [Acinetobacter ursingii]MDI3236662.1 TfpX/TfpZ family type IV pilin accessory protein [Acinetobacter ursingii]PMC97960.1 type IV pilin accessory protein [Acinetobacter ursingii]
MSKRLKFFLSHLSISFLIALLVVGLVFFIWYPSPLASAVGVTHIFLMLLVIDVILGPLLGLLVYKEGKKTLKFDLSVIILIQIAALCYGVFSIEQGRPAWLVFHVDRFELVRKNDLILENIDQAQPQFQQVSWTGPQFVAVKLAVSPQQRQNDMFTEVLGGISLAQQPERYVELTQAKTSIKQRAQPLVLLNDFNDPKVVKMMLTQYPQATAFLPLKANAVDMVVLVNKESASIIKIVDLRPWE